MNKLLATTALVFSLALSGVSYAADGAPKAYDESHFMGGSLSKLPQKDADQFRATMKQTHEKNKATYEQIRALRKDMNGILTAPTFDKGAYLAKSTEIQKLEGDAHAATAEAMATAFSQLSQDERKTLAEGMHDWRKSRMHRGHDTAPAAAK